MATQVATPKQTGGGGFNYEDKVGAYFLLCMLLEKHPFSSELGVIRRIDLQKSAGGWAFDDYVISLSYGEEVRSVGISVKSNQQFSKNVIYKGALELLWEQKLQLNNRVFNPHEDFFCFAQPPLDGNIRHDLDTLINLAKHQDPVDLETNITTPGYTSSDKLDLYKSFYCPAKLNQDAGDPGLLPGAVLSRFMVLEFDFEAVISKSESELLQLSGQVLSDPSEILNRQLYEKLQQICKDRRAFGGFIDLAELLNELRHLFKLRVFPSFRHAFELITHSTNRSLSIIKTSIGGQFEIDRSALLTEISIGYENVNVLAVTAPSGYGKTSLAKLYVESVQKEQTVLWSDASFFESDLESKLDLSYSIRELIDGNTESMFLIVIDGLERFYSESQIRNFSILLKDIALSKGEYKILLTSIDEDFDDIMIKLDTHGAMPSALKKLVIDNHEINVISLVSHFPHLSDVMRNYEIKSLFSNIKILDALSSTITGSNANEFDKELITESEIIDFLWKRVIEVGNSGMLGSNVAKSIAKMQAETLYMGISTSVVDAASASALSVLVTLGILYEYEDYLYFQHDLYGDWARYKIIRSNAQNIKSFIDSINIVSPLWAKAFRQYGIFLLEQKTNEKGWLKLYQQLDESNSKEKIIKDILLESVIFSTGAKRNLGLLKNELLSENCSLLKRLLETFLTKATAVNPKILKIVEGFTGYSATQAAVLHRIPIYEYWPSIIDFIFEHREIIISDDFYHCARISRDWLIHTAQQTIGRKEMALLAVDLSNEIFAERISFYGNKISKDCAFEGLLCGYNEVPDIAGKVILQLAGRIQPAEQENKTVREIVPKSHRFREAQKWNDGPFFHLDNDFIDVCLNRGALLGVFELNPQLANEVMLSTLIKAPSDDYYRDGGIDDFDLNIPRQWSPAFFRRGPFLNFLYTNHLAALDGIIKFVDFATGQWRTLYKSETETPFEILEIDGEKRKYYGDLSLFFWYRGIGIPPSSLVSALMATERYLYEIKEDSFKIEECIDYILKQSESLAFIGMLVSVGKGYPILFKGVLKPILYIMKFYIWEKHNIISYQLEQYGLNNLPKVQAEEAMEWNKTDFRTTPLDDLMIRNLLLDSDFRVIYDDVREKWEAGLSKMRSNIDFDIYQDRLLSFFNPENYVIKPYKDDLLNYEYIEPADLVSRMNPIRESYDARQIVPSAFTIYKIIKDEKQIKLSDIENFWELLEKLKLRNFEDWFSTLETPLSSILGGYVLLLKFKDVWIDDYPAYYETILTYTTTIFERIEKEEIKVLDHSIEYSWNIFLPNLVAYLWKDADLPLTRKWITLIFTSFHSELVNVLFSSLAKIWGWNHEQFIELQNYTLEYAKIDNVPAFNDRTEAETELIGLNNRFIAGEITKDPCKWEQYRKHEVRRKSAFERMFDTNNQMDFLNPGLDLSLLRFAYNSLPISNLNDNKEEWDHILFLWKEALEQVICQFGSPDNSRTEIEEFPDEFDIWVIRSIPSLISEPMPVDFFSYFAEPLLKFGYITPQWTEIYCESLLLNNLDRADHYDAFIWQWQRVVKFCLEGANWAYKEGRNGKYLPLSLFLLNSGNANVWEYNYSGFTIKAISVFENFFEKKIMAPPVVKACCKFLKTPSGRPFLKWGLSYVDLTVKYYQEHFKGPIPKGRILQPYYAIDELGAFLSKVWEVDGDTIRADSTMFNHYKDLVLFLVSIHNSIGLELQRLLQVNN
ncbi:hypothetical protein RAH57_03815 [Chryseobacterium sp. CKR4-1]|uniref:hypothetical protein n=1 Tax=Chryseobacterium sp. CKR4-1 TaxID=3068896 RepID=UPI0027968985|nr:hypothetical protein [Chryseobacterium sp. CKR4-1]MDQ1803098.1 hypothetical protein [Chryseobacterium sp. CKR4-1]